MANPQSPSGISVLDSFCIEKAESRIAVHKEIREHDKQRNIHIDRGNTRLNKVHEIKRKQDRRHYTDPRLLKELLGEIIDDRHHQNTEQRSHKSPAKRTHTKDQNAERDQLLAEWRMGVLIAIQLDDIS